MIVSFSTTGMRSCENISSLVDANIYFISLSLPACVFYWAFWISYTTRWALNLHIPSP
jgi:hypothetical protein